VGGRVRGVPRSAEIERAGERQAVGALAVGAVVGAAADGEPVERQQAGVGAAGRLDVDAGGQRGLEALQRGLRGAAAGLGVARRGRVLQVVDHELRLAVGPELGVGPGRGLGGGQSGVGMNAGRLAAPACARLWPEAALALPATSPTTRTMSTRARPRGRADIGISPSFSCSGGPWRATYSRPRSVSSHLTTV